MKRIGKCSVLMAVLLALPFTAAGYDNIVTFGDSLTDSGNILAVSPASYDSENYYEGRFSNGPVWADYFAGLLGVDNAYLIANLLAGEWDPPEGNVWYNCAFGGAETGALVTPPGFLTQVGLWVTAGLPLPENSLCVVWIGGNDFLNWLDDHSIIQDDPADDITASVTNIITGLTMLTDPQYGLSASDILIINLPDLGKTPSNNGTYGEDYSEYATSVSQAFNAALTGALNDFETGNPDVNLMRYDIFSLMGKLYQHPRNYGFLNAAGGALFETAPTYGFDNVGEYLFWDTIHPTTESHDLLADQFFGRVFITDDANVFFLETAGDARQIAGVASSAEDMAVTSIAADSDADPTPDGAKPDEFNLGVFEFNVNLDPGETAEFTVYLPSAASDDEDWYQAGESDWIDFDRSDINDFNGDGAVFDEDRKRVTLFITDNGAYDENREFGAITSYGGLVETYSDSDDSSSSSSCFINTVFK